MILMMCTLLFSKYFSLFANAEQLNPDQIPVDVLQVFEELYPEAEEVSWSEINNTYVADFYEGQHYQTAIFEAQGIWVSTTAEIGEEELPEIALDYLYDNFENLEYLDYVKKITTPENTQFKISFTTSDGSVTLVFSKEGRLLQRS